MKKAKTDMSQQEKKYIAYRLSHGIYEITLGVTLILLVIPYFLIGMFNWEINAITISILIVFSILLGLSRTFEIVLNKKFVVPRLKNFNMKKEYKVIRIFPTIVSSVLFFVVLFLIGKGEIMKDVVYIICTGLSISGGRFFNTKRFYLYGLLFASAMLMNVLFFTGIYPIALIGLIIFLTGLHYFNKFIKNNKIIDG